MRSSSSFMAGEMALSKVEQVLQHYTMPKGRGSKGLLSPSLMIEEAAGSHFEQVAEITNT